jgi:hypothetical protein
MSRRNSTFKKADVTRALKAAQAAGVDVARIKIATDGTIELDIGQSAEENEGQRSARDQWDEALK